MDDFTRRFRWSVALLFVALLLWANGVLCLGDERRDDEAQVESAPMDDGAVKLSRMKTIESQPSRIIKSQPLPTIKDGQLTSTRVVVPPNHWEADGTGEQKNKQTKTTLGVLQRLQIRGTALLSYNIQDVEAKSSSGRAAFVQENYGSAKSLYHYTSVIAEGQLIGKLRVRAQFNTPSYNPRSNTFVLEYPMGNFLLRYGDLTLSFSGNRFASLSRWTRGIELRYSLDGNAEKVYGIGQGSTSGNELIIVTAEGKSQVKRDVIQGNNTSGPFFLSSSPVVEGSEQVFVDMRLMKRGEDYQIDYDVGTITFLGATIIPSTSTIVVTYEAAQPGEGIGRFWGARLNWRSGNSMRIGVSFLTQGAAQRQAGDASRKLREEFVGANTVGPFQLSQRPIVEGSETVSVNGIPHVRDKDYIINYISGLITFVRPVPAGAIIAVEYEQRVSHGAVIGQLSVMGIDADIKLGSIGSANLQWAFSNGPTRSGTAIEISSQLSLGRLEQGKTRGKREEAKQRGNEVSDVAGTPTQSPEDEGLKEITTRVDQGERWGASAQQGEALRLPTPRTPSASLRRSLGEPSWSGIGYGGGSTYTLSGVARTQLSLRLLKVTPGFSRIENADFYQNESGVEVNLTHRFTEHLSLTSQWVNASSSYLRGAYSNAQSSTSSNRFYATLSYEKPNAPVIRLAYQRFGFGGSSKSDYASASALISYRRGRWGVDTAYEDNSQSVAGLLNTARVRTRAFRFTSSFEPSEKLSLSVDYSSNRSSGVSQSSSVSNLLFGVRFQPWRSMQLSLTHNILVGSSGTGLGSFITGGASGTYSGLPYITNPYGFGYGGYTTPISLGGYGTLTASQRPVAGLGGTAPIGYSSPSMNSSWGNEVWRSRQVGSNMTGATSNTNTNTNNRSIITTASLDWQPSSRLSLACQWSYQFTRGSSFIADYKNTDYGAQLTYQLSSKVTLMGHLSRQKNSFFNPNSDAFTSIYGLGMQYAGKRLNMSLSLDTLSSVTSQQLSSEGEFKNKFSSATLNVGYRLGERLDLSGTFVHARNKGMGGYGQNSFRVAVGYRIFEQLWLDLNIERIDRKDLAGTNSDYKATILSFQLRGSF
jgi:hypothetical protein